MGGKRAGGRPRTRAPRPDLSMLVARELYYNALAPEVVRRVADSRSKLTAAWRKAKRQRPASVAAWSQLQTAQEQHLSMIRKVDDLNWRRTPWGSTATLRTLLESGGNPYRMAQILDSAHAVGRPNATTASGLSVLLRNLRKARREWSRVREHGDYLQTRRDATFGEALERNAGRIRNLRDQLLQEQRGWEAVAAALQEHLKLTTGEYQVPSVVRILKHTYEDVYEVATLDHRQVERARRSLAPLAPHCLEARIQGRIERRMRGLSGPVASMDPDDFSKLGRPRGSRNQE